MSALCRKLWEGNGEQNLATLTKLLVKWGERLLATC